MNRKSVEGQYAKPVQADFGADNVGYMHEIERATVLVFLIYREVMRMG